MIDRPTYLAKLLKWKDRDVIKVVTGVRRCGKSVALSLFRERLLAEGVAPDHIISYNLEFLEDERLKDYRVLHDEILSRLHDEAMHYVFVDEIQNVDGFQFVLDSLYVRSNIDLYVTGSNALLLGDTLATLLSGRYVEINMTPLSFSEYRSAFEGEMISNQRLYSRYLACGGFPAAISLDDDMRYDYLVGVLNTVLFKDVVQRMGIANTLGLNALVDYLYDNIGNIVSANSIAEALCRGGVRISANTVGEYLSGLKNSYIFYQAKRYDVRGRRILEQKDKFYASDLGMRRVVLSNQVRDAGRLLENLVYLELRRRCAAVYVGKMGDAEVDFVVEGSSGRAYYQVAQTVVDPTTLERELKALNAIRDNCKKVLLTLDDEEATSIDGIVKMNALDWMLGMDEPEG